MTREPAGGPPGRARRAPSGTRVPLAYLAAGPARRRSRTAGPCRSRRVVVAARERLLVGPDRQLVGAEQVVLGRGGVVLRGRPVRRQVRARRHVVGLGLRLLLRRHLGGLEERLGARVRGVGPAVAEHVRLPVVELELRGGAHLLMARSGVLHVGQADRDLVAAGALDLGLGRHRARRCACGSC